MSQVFHHFDNRKNAIGEIVRVLAPDGILAIRNGTRETDEETYWVQCFPERYTGTVMKKCISIMV
jgi:ubiquinone/menaquinone biosynthesis C-methylase UbiE